MKMKSIALATVLAGIALSPATAATIVSEGTATGSNFFVQSATFGPTGADAEVEIASIPGSYDNNPTTPSSAWVWNLASGFASTSTVVFGYSFDLTGYDLSTASLSGLYGFDNTGTISLNGNTFLTENNISNFSSLSSYSTTEQSFFNQGENTVLFSATDVGAPAGFRATIVVEAVESGGENPDVIPLPAGLPLILSGIGAFVLMRRRTEKS